MTLLGDIPRLQISLESAYSFSQARIVRGVRFHRALGGKTWIVFLQANGEQTCQSNLVPNQLQNQLANRINAGVTTRKPQRIRLTSSLTNTKKVINGGGVHLNEVPSKN